MQNTITNKILTNDLSLIIQIMDRAYYPTFLVIFNTHRISCKIKRNTRQKFFRNETNYITNYKTIIAGMTLKAIRIRRKTKQTFKHTYLLEYSLTFNFISFDETKL